MELDLYCLPEDAFQAPGSCGQDPDVLTVDMVTQVCVVLCYGRSVRILQPDMLVVLNIITFSLLFISCSLCYQPSSKEEDIEF
jgi:hypothetical protein